MNEQKGESNNRASRKTYLLWQHLITEASSTTDKSFSNTHIWQKTVTTQQQKSFPPEAFS
jgi:hypothetical protein